MRKQELEKEISQIWNILIIAKECFQYSYYLHKPDTLEEQEYLNYSRDFGFIRHILWRMSIIELSKLFSQSSKRDRYNLSHFINKVKIDGYFGDSGIEKKRIANWEEQIQSNDQVIKKILNLRDKIYAHTDSNKEEYSAIEITFVEVENLILIVEEIIKGILSDAFDSEADMHNLIFERNSFNIIKILAKEKKERIEQRFKRG